MKTLLTFLMLTLGVQAADDRVANFSYGTPGQENYEEFSFWVKNNQPAEIQYVYGKDRKTLRLRYLKQDKRHFQVRFPNQLVLLLSPQGNQLRVYDLKGKYAAKTFSWHYEGPVNGVGTFCQACAEDETEAMQLLRRYYFVP